MADIDLSTTELKGSYGVGMQMGQQLKGAFNGVSLAAAIAGIKDGFNGQQPRIEVALQAHGGQIVGWVCCPHQGSQRR